MTSIHFKGAMGKLFLAFSLVFGISIISSMTAQAQYRNDPYAQDNRDRGRRGGRYNDGYGDYGGSYELRQTALNAGANEGIKAGRKDRRRGERYDFSDEREYQKATKDYSSRLGDRYIYQRYFRAAFEHAYADGYSGY